MQNLMIMNEENLSLLAINITVLGEFTIDSLKSKGIELIYDDNSNFTDDRVQLSHTIRIVQFELISTFQRYSGLFLFSISCHVVL